MRLFEKTNGILRLNPAHLNELFTYDAKKGELRWAIRPLDHFADERVWRRFNNNMSGKVAGHKFQRAHNKYIAINIHNQQILAHRAAWAIHHNEDPCYDNIIAVDDNLHNIKIDNLRKISFEVRHSLPTYYKKSDGLPKNIMFIKNMNSYRISISVGGKLLHFGHYATINDAQIVLNNIKLISSK